MRKAAEDVTEWTCEGSLKSAGRVWLTGFPPLSRERVCLHTTEWTFLYVNLGGTAEVTGFCPMMHLHRETKAFFYCVCSERTDTRSKPRFRSNAEEKPRPADTFFLPLYKKAGAILARLLGRAARTRPAFL